MSADQDGTVQEVAQDGGEALGVAVFFGTDDLARLGVADATAIRFVVKDGKIEVNEA